MYIGGDKELSYQYSDFPNKDDFQNWEYFENINNIDKDNINADREYLVSGNKRLSAQFVNTVLDAIRAIEKFIQDLSKKKPDMSDVAGTLPITHGGTGATTASNALKNFGLTATAADINYTKGVTSNIQTQLNNKLDKSGVSGSLNYTDNFSVDTLNGVKFECNGFEIMQIIDSGVDIQNGLRVGGNLIVAGAITNTDLTNRFDKKADTNHTHTDATITMAGFMSPADKKKLDSIAENAGQNMDNYVAKSGNGFLSISNYNDITLSPRSSFIVESNTNEVLNVSNNQFEIVPNISASGNLDVKGSITAKNIETSELRIGDINTSNNHIVYTIHTDVFSNRLDFFKILGGDSLIKMTFEPDIADNIASANGKIEIEGDVDIDSGSTLSVTKITSDNNLNIYGAKDYTVTTPGNIVFEQPSAYTADGNSASFTIKKAAAANRKGGTLVFSRNNQDVLRIGEKDDADGQPVYNQFRFEGDEVHFLLNSTGSMFQATADQVQIRHSSKAKLILDQNGVRTTELYFHNLGFSPSQEIEHYLKSNSVQEITYDILQRITALEDDGSSGGGGNCNCEAITEAELNAMFNEIGL